MKPRGDHRVTVTIHLTPEQGAFADAAALRQGQKFSTIVHELVLSTLKYGEMP